MSDDATGNSGFSHLSDDGGISMVDVAAKAPTSREAVAEATVRMSPATLRKLIDQALPKGDVLTTAKVAGILAAKQTSSLIPLTHPLPVTYIDLAFETDAGEGTIVVRATVRCDGKTGVEIEAMTACAIASLTIYDMCKSAEKGIVIDALQLVRKSGGKSGTYERVKGENKSEG
jgi:cyclic pyranopterin phosphate synthase